MTVTPSAYRTVISARSRRLRTVGLILLVATVSMALYGALVLMPRFSRSIKAEAQVAGISASHSLVAPASALTFRQRRARRIALTQAVTAYAYWSVCGLLVTAMLVVGYLDFREVNRTYMAQRLHLLQETTLSLQKSKENGA